MRAGIACVRNWRDGAEFLFRATQTRLLISAEIFESEGLNSRSAAVDTSRHVPVSD
ncbi:hypothetical protein RSSM_06204 [Rhodopirellula sallentina SM41]|uniref:Uncharacterized protein n=1 Tax=Rhodopirellula sallentina SM41 TaxID=1263870 RepID=M5U8Q9_9BACT|nr:hypothetical protein RSSM_06204 [Rhodopirellula sallentina SM41]